MEIQTGPPLAATHGLTGRLAEALAFRFLLRGEFLTVFTGIVFCGFISRGSAAGFGVTFGSSSTRGDVATDAAVPVTGFGVGVAEGFSSFASAGITVRIWAEEPDNESMPIVTAMAIVRILTLAFLISIDPARFDERKPGRGCRK